MIDQATIDRIMNAAQIVEVVSDFVSLRKRGVNYQGLCPFHDEKTPSFSVSPSKGICKCFSCGKGGNPVHFIMEHEQLSFQDALKYLAKKYSIEIVEKEMTNEERQAQNERESMFIINAFAQQYFSRILYENPEGIAVGLAYFRERGFRDDVIKKFQLGFSPETRDAFTQEALRSGYKKDFLLKTGLTLEHDGQRLSDRFRGRVMFPVHTLSGKVVAFGGRILKKDEKMAKYLNSPESTIYHKSNELYGLYLAKQAIVKHDRCFLVEGYTDVLSMHQAGIENVVASSGTALTPGQIRLIHRFSNNITVLYDGDAAGIKASIRGIDLLLKEGMNIKVVLLPQGEDPDSFSQKQSASSFIEYIKANETDFIRFKTSLLLEEAGQDPIKRAALISDIVRSIALIPEDIVKAVYIKECSHLLEIDEKVLINEINKLKISELEKEMTRTQADYVPAEPDPTPEELAQAFAEPVPIKRDTRYDPYEREIIRLVVRYGEIPFFNFNDEETQQEYSYTVAEYIAYDLQQDEIELRHPIYKIILEECAKHCRQEEFRSERYFVTYPDIETSKMAIELSTDRYQLSKIHSKFQTVEHEQDRLLEVVPKATMALKDAMLRDEIRTLQEELKRMPTMERIMEIQQRLIQINEIRVQLAKELGERIVVR
ncbi:DNA primase [Parabacteroides sp. FAFU027]|uniref:DNA primase n=1 Tax=Parabacteroides sp. FAFU027 TaxID=2922715 RepID=UPI001FAE9FC5|nr:DNA primase [Parabacteroides sp. FAFU027]